MRVDESTLNGSRIKIARISIEVDMNKALISKFRLIRRIQKVEYKGIYTSCMLW